MEFFFLNGYGGTCVIGILVYLPFFDIISMCNCVWCLGATFFVCVCVYKNASIPSSPITPSYVAEVIRLLIGMH